MKKRKYTKRTDGKELIRHFLEVSRTVLEGEKRASYLAFLHKYEGKGVYALYSKGELWYVGKASTLKTRIDQHLKDMHKDKWDRFAIYVFPDSKGSKEVHQLESLLLKIAKPPGNKKDGKLPGSLQKTLERFLINDAKNEIKEMIHGVKNSDTGKDKDTRLTAKRLRTLKRKKLADILGVTVGRVNQLWYEDSNLTAMRQYIVEKGMKNKVLEHIDSNE
ncbi:MAG TPA: GIY-YIG nuclease family protein [Bacteroidia bacterium]|jgi:hypothetical protein|nr:GIY-YIG nuclease family protein [Bacteroidia bacterium]